MEVAITIIIPCYNSYSHMERCLKSIEMQTYRNFEVLFIDDCSQDDTYEQLQKYKNNSNFSVRLYRLDKNSGPGVARNYGIKKAKGKYICFCDSDDWYEIDFLEKMYNKIISSKSEIVMCNYKKHTSTNTELMNYTKYFSSRTKRDYIINSKTSMCLLMINRNLFNGLDIPKLYNGEDIAFVPIIESKAKKISHVDDYLYNYYIRKNSLSTKKDEKIYLSLIESFLIIKKNILLCDEVMIEYIGIKTIIYGVTLILFKLKKDKLISGIISSFEDDFPKWNTNTYINNLPTYKRLYLFCIKHRLYFICRFYALIHSKMEN